MKKPIILLPLFLSAHKGARGSTKHLPDSAFSDGVYPENSMASIKQSVALGADIIEADPQLTKDKKVVIAHRDDLSKIAYPRGGDNHISKQTLDELKKHNIGGGHRITSLKEILDYAAEENKRRKEENIPDLEIYTTLANDEMTEAIYAEILPYLEQKLLKPENFIFTTDEIDGETLYKIKEKNPKFKVIAHALTKPLYGEENVNPLTYEVKEGATYKQETLQRLKDFHENIPGGCYAVQCLMSDLEEPLLEFCKENKIGFFTVSLKETDNIPEKLALMMKYEDEMNLGFESDFIPDTQEIIKKNREKLER